MDVNLKSAFFLAQAVVRRILAEGRGGKVINIASMLSFQGGLRVASHTASKSGLAGFDRGFWPMSGRRVESTSTPSRPAISTPTIPRR